MKSLRRGVTLISIIFASVLLLACNGDDARTFWSEVLNKCATPGVMGGDVLYFGPSNSVGLGSIWEKQQGGGYALRALASNYTNNPDSFTQKGNMVTCSGNTSASNASGGVLTFAPKGVTAEASADFKKARKVTVKVGGFRWDQVIGVPFESLFKTPGAVSEAYRDELQSANGRFVMTKVLYITDLEGTLEFSIEDGAKLKAKYAGPTQIGDLGIDVNAQMTDDTTLSIKTSTGFYISGELRPWEEGLAAASTSSLGEPEQDLMTKPVSVDLIK